MKNEIKKIGYSFIGITKERFDYVYATEEDALKEAKKSLYRARRGYTWI